MAIAGDVIIKLAADFAEFVKGMDESKKQLGEFGKKAQEVSDGFSSAFNKLKAFLGGAAIIETVRRISAEADRLHEKFAAIATEGEKLGVGFEAFEQLRLSAMQAGVGVSTLTDTMGKFKTLTDQAMAGNKEAIATLDKLGVTILDNNKAQRDQTDINQRLAQAIKNLPPGLERTRLEMSLLGKSGDAAAASLDLLSKRQDQLANSPGLAALGDTVAKLEELRIKSEAAAEKTDLLIAKLLLPIKVQWLEDFARSMTVLVNTINGLKVGNVDSIKSLFAAFATFAATGGNVGAFFSTLSGTAPDAMKVLQKTADDAAAVGAKLDKEFAETERRQAAGENMTNRYMRLAKEREAAAQAIRDANQALYNAQRQGPQGPNVPGQGEQPGANPPAVTTSGGGGGKAAVGKSDVETIDALITRYGKMRESAEAARQAILANTKEDIDQVAIRVQARQDAIDAIAKIEQRLGAQDPARIKQLEEAIFLAKVANAESEKSLKFAQDADKTTKRLGDGTEAYADAMRNLNRQKASGRLTDIAFNRAMKEQIELLEGARLQAKRYDDDLGSLFAGFEKAALDFSRSNDLFTQGGALFQGVTNAMGEGLDVLMGKSTKTFGQIAADFVTMLAKMAVAAAISKVFSIIFGGGSPISAIAAPAGGYSATLGMDGLGSVIPRASGGPVEPGGAYWVGEHGPERFVPSVAGTIEPARAGMSVVVNNYAPGVDVRARQRPDNSLELTVQAVTKKLSRDVARGGNEFSTSLERAFRLNRGGA